MAKKALLFIFEHSNKALVFYALLKAIHFLIRIIRAVSYNIIPIMSHLQ